jgi:uncharacterized protein
VYFVLKLSKLCNLRCVYCYEYEELGDRTRMPLEGLGFLLESVAAEYRRRGWTFTLNFVLHGGEPLLLPGSYLRSFVELQRRHLDGIPYLTSVQTNLYRFDRAKLALLEELEIGIGVSIDVFGDQRLTAGGRDSQQRVLDNLQLLFDTDAVRRLGVGGISVLHAGNAEHAVSTFRFFESLGLSFRMLPIFSLIDVPPRMAHLTLPAEHVVETLQRVARAQLDSDGPAIQVYPLRNYLEAAISHVSGIAAPPYDPVAHEWAVIVNTNGDAYNHGDAYTGDGLFGNAFTTPFGELLASGRRRRSLELRAERACICDTCTFASSCSHVPVVEALPSERSWEDGRLSCAVARPMIEFYVEEIRRSQRALTLIETTVETHATAVA